MSPCVMLVRAFVRWPCVLAPLLLALGACAADDIVVAIVPMDAATHDGSTEDAGSRPDASGQARCVRDEDCGEDAYCEKTGCAEPQGTCAPRPTFCSSTPAPVCGCDGITYFNDCLRQENGVAVQGSGECFSRTMFCDERAPCPYPAYCGKLRSGGPFCSPEGPGHCWILPAVCDPNPAGGDRYVACGGPGECEDLCTAIRSERSHARVPRCPIQN